MIQGLQIRIAGEDLIRRIVDRMKVHETAVDALNARINARAGDEPFDVRPEDYFKTVPELASERAQHEGRLLTLSLVSSGIAPAESYAVTESDLRLAGLIEPAPDRDGDVETTSHVLLNEGPLFTEGLRLTFAGSELHQLLQERIERHRRCAEDWKREQARTPEEQTDEHPLLPDHMCENEAERHDWRARVLDFIRAHIDSGAVYRLGEADLLFGELLPEKPGWLEQEEYEERTSVGFHLERLTKRLGELRPMRATWAPS
jgi:hypothetical protein